MSQIALNYDSLANVDDGTCEYIDEWVYGCTYENAINYNSEATFDDGSCEFIWGDVDMDGSLTISDIIAIVQIIPNGEW